MYSILRSLLNHSYLMPEGVVTTVFFHTSCVLDSTLKQLSESKYLRSKYKFLITDDCYHEITLLKNRSKIKRIAENAGILIGLCERAEKLNLRNLYGFFKSDYSSVLTKILMPNEKRPYIFVFYNGTVAEEFVNHTLPNDEIRNHMRYKAINLSGLDHVRILLFNKNEDLSVNTDYIYSAPVRLSAFGQLSTKCRRFRKPPRVIELSDEPYLSDDGVFLSDESKIYLKYIGSGKIQVVNIKDLKKYQWGGTAYVYHINVPGFEKKVAKIFKKKRNDPAVTEYLKYMSGFKDMFGNRLVLPEAFIYNSKNEFIGFTMNYLEHAIRVKCIDQTDFLQSKERTAQLSLLMLEMRLFQLEINDISDTNFSIMNDRVMFFDPDSIESRNFIYSRPLYNKNFAHPDLLEHGYKKSFRPIRFNDFAYSVILFQLFILYHPLEKNRISDDSDDYKDWLEAKEGIKCISLDSTRFVAYSDTIWLRYFSDEQRKFFLSSFDFDPQKLLKACSVKIPTIGQWLGLFNIK